MSILVKNAELYTRMYPIIGPVDRFPMIWATTNHEIKTQ